MLGRKPDLNAGVLSAEDTASIQAQVLNPCEWTRTHKLPDAAKEVLMLPDDIWQRLVDLWQHCPLEDIMKEKSGRFRLTLELHESREGFVVLYAEGSLTGEKPIVGFLLIDEDDTVKLDFPYTDMPPQPTKEELAWVRSLWVAFEPVATIRAVKKRRPNDRCEHCGRKVKRCICGEI